MAVTIQPSGNTTVGLNKSDTAGQLAATQCSGTTKTLVIACGAIAHELVAVSKASGWQHLDIQCLPAEWHNHPQLITPAVEKKILEFQEQYQQIFVAYADCGTGGHLDALLSQHNIQRLPGNHCYDFFAGQDIFSAMAAQELGTFYLTDYLVDNFQRLIMDGMGITQHPELLDQYFSHYTRLLYLRQNTNGQQVQMRVNKAYAAAEALQLPLQIHDTGLTHFTQALIPLQRIKAE